jgi:beta-lactam-binding protein with PASTA domain
MPALRLLAMDKTLSPPTGQLLDGRYRVDSRLARGGMATVYLGTDTRLDRTVALKIAHPELSGDEEFVRRFMGEARSAAKLSSPNVVAVYDQGSDGDIHYLAMEYVPGVTLRALLDERGRLSPREALDITEGVLAGLAVAHQSGIVHRDVKPENVLLTTANTVKVADFGLARAAAGGAETRAGMIIGTAAYLAPEQVSRSTSDERTDVYAVGVMLFELLTGTQPHTGETPLAVAYKHVSDVVPAPSSVVPGLPPALDALVALATSRDPELRPSDASHFLLAITEVRHGMPISGARPRGQQAAPGSAYGAPGSSYQAPGSSYQAPGGAYGAGGAGGIAAGAAGAFAAGEFAARPWESRPDPGVQAAASGPLNGGQPSGGGHHSDGAHRGDGGQPVGAQHSDGGQPGGGYHSGGGRPGGQLPDSPPTADLAAWPAAPGTASGSSSWPTAGHPQAAEPRHGAAGPALPAPRSPGEPGQAAELLPVAAVIPPDRHRAENHTLIVATGGLETGFRDGPGYYHEDRPGRGYRRRGEPRLQRWLFSRRLGYVAAAMAVVLVAGLAFWWISDGQYATVPSVGGIAASTAATELQNLGFTVKTGQGRHSNLPRGYVVRTIPATGSRAKSGSPVTIIESIGPIRKQVPSVSGMQLSDAISNLRQAGLTPGTVSPQTSTTIPAGVVISTTPVAGVSWPENKPVAITVSAGQPLPDFRGMNVSQAQGMAQSGGYAINPVQQAKGTLPQGTITRQSPAPGSPIAQSEVVTVYFSPGPPMATVPSVFLMPVDQAVQALQQAGFKVTVNQVGPGNRVINFSPNGQQPVGTTITINVGL